MLQLFIQTKAFHQSNFFSYKEFIFIPVFCIRHCFLSDELLALSTFFCIRLQKILIDIIAWPNMILHFNLRMQFYSSKKEYRVLEVTLAAFFRSALSNRSLQVFSLRVFLIFFSSTRALSISKSSPEDLQEVYLKLHIF